MEPLSSSINFLTFVSFIEISLCSATASINSCNAASLLAASRNAFVKVFLNCRKPSKSLLSSPALSVTPFGLTMPSRVRKSLKSLSTFSSGAEIMSNSRNFLRWEFWPLLAVGDKYSRQTFPLVNTPSFGFGVASRQYSSNCFSHPSSGSSHCFTSTNILLRPLILKL